MSQTYEFDRSDGFAISNVEARAGFIVKTYLHVFASIIVFIALETLLISAGAGEALIRTLQGMGNPFIPMLLIFGLFIGGTFAAQALANSRSLPMQYAGLGLYTAIETLFFLPILSYLILRAGDRGVMIITAAGGTTFLLTAALTAVVFITRRDFSFLRGVLWFGSIAAFGFILVALFFPVAMGGIYVYFLYAMAAFMCLWILYDTSNILHHYGEDQYVAAALALFASVMTLFWYILRIYMYLSDRE